ncbi:NHL repeat-containing protein [Aeromicrobium sp.]|uniref:NHL repeat-containing protein n=1 Tax=Aeromicrobium sp. TaxID=1871063 RepID=UPI0025BF2F79|nr:NHL repeat-containing protein [Aeromicrobium sp.]
MRVTVIPPGTSHPGVQMGSPVGFIPTPSASGPWRPRACLGAISPGGLMLPEAKPTESQFYAPRGVHIVAERVVVADTGNHRVLIFNGHPDRDSPSCDVVLGQPDAFTEGPQAGGRGPSDGMFLPTGVLVTDAGQLVVSDAWNHRLLVWDTVPDHATAPDLVLGQKNDIDVLANAGGAPSATVFYWPFGIAVVDGRFYVADTGNRRVLCWSDGVPTSPDQPADVILGQGDAISRDENAGDEAGPDSFRWPHAIAGDGAGGVLVADAGDHRLLGWSRHPVRQQDADLVLGQGDFTTAVEFPYAPQTGTRFRFPYGVVRVGDGLAVADTANNRVLIWDDMPRDPETDPQHVLGQPSFAKNGENRWQEITPDTLCWPYGLGAHGNLLAIADSGNNRVVLWEKLDAGPDLEQAGC